MVRFNKFHLGELVRNIETKEQGRIVGLRDTTGIPEYQVVVPIEPDDWEHGSALALWLETVLERPLSGGQSRDLP